MYKEMYDDEIKQFVFENSIDCLYYGYGFDYLNKCGLSDEEAREIWKKAKNHLANSF